MNNQSNEIYLNHPTFGLLYRICFLKENQELFTTLYAQRLFFTVTTNSNSVSFDPISRSDARLLVESLLRRFLLDRETEKHRQLQAIYQRLMRKWLDFKKYFVWRLNFTPHPPK